MQIVMVRSFGSLTNETVRHLAWFRTELKLVFDLALFADFDGTFNAIAPLLVGEQCRKERGKFLSLESGYNASESIREYRATDKRRSEALERVARYAATSLKGDLFSKCGGSFYSAGTDKRRRESLPRPENVLVVSHSPLVQAIAMRFYPEREDLEDVSLGFCEGFCFQYDPERQKTLGDLIILKRGSKTPGKAR